MKSFYKTIWYVLAAFFLVPHPAIAKPDDNQIIFWISTQDVVLKKRKILPDKHEKLKPANIKELKLVKSQQQNEVLTMKETAKFEFIYFYEKDLPCDANITYSWTRFKSNYELQSVIVDCQID